MFDLRSICETYWRSIRRWPCHSAIAFFSIRLFARGENPYWQAA